MLRCLQLIGMLSSIILGVGPEMQSAANGNMCKMPWNQLGSNIQTFV